jgi:hypothetical protein
MVSVNITPLRRRTVRQAIVIDVVRFGVRVKTAKSSINFYSDPELPAHAGRHEYMAAAGPSSLQ